MRPSPFVLAALLAISTAVPLQAQAPPDLSGRWTSDPLSATGAPAPGRRGGPLARPDLGSGWGSTITIAQDARQLTVEYAFFTRGDMQPPLKFTYALDGSMTRTAVMMGRGRQVEQSQAARDGETLVIRTTVSFTDPGTRKAGSVEVVRRLSLESPESLVVETARSGALGGPPSTTRVVYRRLPPSR